MRVAMVLVVSLVVLPWFARKVHGDESVEFFESRIRPVLVKHCYECHHSGLDYPEGGLVLDHRTGLRLGGESGPAIVPGDPAASRLLSALRHESLQMPPDELLPAEVIADFETWIRHGAVDPRDQPPSGDEVAGLAWRVKLAERSGWWSLQPPRWTDPPAVDDTDWARDPIDRFILAGLRAQGLSPSAAAEPEVLIRRLSFVLTGLPPEPAEVLEFLAAYRVAPDETLVRWTDRLLDSPHFGERFARHWMDVVRYTDTFGYEWDNPIRGSWEYRDYLIRAFNADVGFDQLIREQIAGDLLESPRLSPRWGVNESLIGPLFFHMGEHRHGSSLDFNGIHQEMIDNKIDVFSKAFLGMTVACARCHDHKLDAVSQADYYALAGVLMTPRWTPRDIDACDHQAATLDELQAVRDAIRAELAKAWLSWLEGGSLDADRLRTWAREQRESLATSPPETVGHVLFRLLPTDDEAAEAATNGFADRFADLAAEWNRLRAERVASNAERFEWLSDGSLPSLPEGWVADGRGWQRGFVADATPLIALEGDALISRLLSQGFHTHALSSKLAGAIRLPAPESFPRRWVSLRLAGGDWAGRATVPQNAFHDENIRFLDPAESAAWHGVTRRDLKNGVTRVLTEFATASLHPNFPPRTGLARAGSTRLPDDDLGRNKRSWFSLTGIVAHDEPGTPQDTLELFAGLFGTDTRDSVSPAEVAGSTASEPTAPTTADWQRVADWFHGAVRRWAVGQPAPGDTSLLNWLLEHDHLPNRLEQAPEHLRDVHRLVERYREREDSLEFARGVFSMDERQVEPVEYRLNVRGDVDREDAAIPRDFLQVFQGQHRVAESSGSGRLELAEYLASADNPQTARVFVNRVWSWVFGTGLVATPNDFGRLGDPPSHPELLDRLAIEFTRDDWSLRRLVRRLVLSQTFRQSGHVHPLAAERDPANRGWHHYPTRRLDAESIRDSLLAVSGRLDRRLFGTPINPHRVAEDPAKRLYSGPLDGNGRRSLYTTASIMSPAKFLVGFNLPDLKLPTGRRDVTNVPAQALILLNDPFVVDLADQWASRLLLDGSRSIEQRLDRMFLAAFGRHPSPGEQSRWVAAVRELTPPDSDPLTDHASWAEIAHALFNTKEFIYHR